MRRASDLDFSLFTFLPLGLGNYNKEAQRTMRQRQFFKQYSSHTIKKKPSEKYLNVEYNSPFNRRELITSSFKFWRVFQSLCKDETSLSNHYQFSSSPKSNLCVWIVFVSFHVTGKTKWIHLHILTQHVCLVLDFLLGSSLFILWKWLKVTSP